MAYSFRRSIEIKDVDYHNLGVFEDDGAKYHLLTIDDDDYLKSLLDGYKNKEGNRHISAS